LHAFVSDESPKQGSVSLGLGRSGTRSFGLCGSRLAQSWTDPPGLGNTGSTISRLQRLLALCWHAQLSDSFLPTHAGRRLHPDQRAMLGECLRPAISAPLSQHSAAARTARGEALHGSCHWERTRHARGWMARTPRIVVAKCGWEVSDMEDKSQGLGRAKT